MNENLILLKTKSAKNGSARLVPVLFQHPDKEERWGGAAQGREGGRQGGDCPYEQHL